jgi:hypothetical protein
MWIVTNNPDETGARPIAQQPNVYSETPELNRGETALHEHAISTAGLPANIRQAAMDEAGGRITRAQHYVTSDTDVYVVRMNATDGVRELRIRQDGVVLLNTLNPPQEQAYYDSRGNRAEPEELRFEE